MADKPAKRDKDVRVRHKPSNTEMDSTESAAAALGDEWEIVSPPKKGAEK